MHRPELPDQVVASVRRQDVRQDREVCAIGVRAVPRVVVKSGIDGDVRIDPHGVFLVLESKLKGVRKIDLQLHEAQMVLERGGVINRSRTALGRKAICSAHRKLDAGWDDARLWDWIVDGRVVFVAFDKLVNSWVDTHSEERKRQWPHREGHHGRSVRTVTSTVSACHHARASRVCRYGAASERARVRA